MSSIPEFRITLNDYYVANVRVQKAPAGGYDLAARMEVSVQNEDKSVEEHDLGWIIVDNRPDLVLRYRDETSWALLPTDIKQSSVDRGWNICTPQELIGVLWTSGILQ